MMLYRDLFAKALSLSWQKKFLWGLAFLSALVGSGGEYELLYSGSDSLNGQSSLLGFLRSFYSNDVLGRMLTNIQTFITENPLAALLLALLLLTLLLIAIWLIIVGQASLIWAIGKLQKNESVAFSVAFTHGIGFVLPIFLINLMAKGIVFGLLLFIAIPLGLAFIQSGQTLYLNLYVLSAFIILIPVTMLLSFIIRYTATYVVLRGQAWSQALKNAWRLFLGNWLVTLEVGLLLFVMNLVSFFILTLLLVLIGLPTTSVGFVTFLILLTLFGVFMTTFQYSTWVHLFLALEEGKVRSKVLRATDGWTKHWTSSPTAGSVK